MATLAEVRPENGAAGGGDDAVPMKQASAAEPERTVVTAKLGVADAVRVAALLGRGRQRTNDALVMITRASNVPLAPGGLSFRGTRLRCPVANRSFGPHEARPSEAERTDAGLFGCSLSCS